MKRAIAFIRIAAGHYATSDGAFAIKRVKSQQTGRRTEICWEVLSKSGPVGFCQESLRDAKLLVKGYY